MFCILIHLHYCSIFFWCFIKCTTCMCRMCSEPMYHPFGNDASHMNLWDAWFSNCLAYFGQSENGDCCVLSGVCLVLSGILDRVRMATVACYLVFVLCPIVLRHTNIGRAIREQWGYATEIPNGRYTRQTPDNTQRSLFLAGFRRYPS
jgi:hypothetical protein